MGAFDSASKALQHEYLLDYILANISDECAHEDCGTSPPHQPPIDTGNPCIHDQIFAQLLRVSTQWFRVAAPYCWNGVTLNQLRMLVEASCMDGVCDTLLVFIEQH